MLFEGVWLWVVTVGADKLSLSHHEMVLPRHWQHGPPQVQYCAGLSASTSLTHTGFLSL